MTVLVIGAGRHGRTGVRVVERLRAHGRDVRVLVRSGGAYVDDLRAHGADVVFGDLLDRRTLTAAVADVDAVYFAYPIAAGAVPAAADSPSALGRAQWAAEEVLAWAGLDPTVLRVAALFYENIVVLHGASIRQSGRFANSFGAGPAPWISGRDAADLAVTALVDPGRYPGAKLAYPCGAELLSHGDVAAIISREIDSPVEFDPVSAEQWQRELEVLATADGVVNPAMAQHISSVGAQLAARSGAAIAPDPAALAAIIGHPPLTLTEFVTEHREEFARQSD